MEKSWNFISKARENFKWPFHGSCFFYGKPEGELRTCPFVTGAKCELNLIHSLIHTYCENNFCDAMMKSKPMNDK